MAALLNQGLDGVGEALCILVDDASKIERSTEWHHDGNGFKPKTVMTRMGKITFAIPKVRGEGAYPGVLEKGSRTDQALNLKMGEM